MIRADIVDIAEMELQHFKDAPPAYPDPPSYRPDRYKTLSIYHTGLTGRSSLITTSSPHSPLIVGQSTPNKPVYYSDVSSWTLGQPSVTLHRGGSNRRRVLAVAQFPYDSTDIKIGMLHGDSRIMGSTNYDELDTQGSVSWQYARPPSLSKNYFWGIAGLPGYSRGELVFRIPTDMIDGTLGQTGSSREIEFVWKRTHHDHMQVPCDDDDGGVVGGGGGEEDVFGGNTTTTSSTDSHRRKTAHSSSSTTSNRRIPFDSFKLVPAHDPSEVVAQFVSRKLFNLHLRDRGQLVFRTDLAAGQTWEALVLISLLSMLEKERRRAYATQGLSS
ncbi:hypothetical protein L228DRAFT_260704 [Xylona heveae TC161]|uniref:Uncharacterized protein n=1 Tax=Xylona heveae (strain CBS 132557 / TC161) TaxID=1328760 RepID=A0A165GS43_XYLHT|nr:hypothetical protein L228DRAFT_260704 [Xylona heveae TC161]KZF22524.1 hypothetical protein L228DRAFT_260704 [Xylona heveae TC161]